VIAIIVNKQADIQAFKDYKGDAKPEEVKAEPKVEQPAPAPAPAPTSSASYPDHTKVGMPALSPTMKQVKNSSIRIT